MTQAQDRLANLPRAYVAKKQEVAEDLFLMWLRPDEPFRFKPGQYITIGTGGIERPYSIASAPYESLIELFIEYVQYGGKLTPLLWNLHVGDSVSMRPRAKGLFVFQPQFHHHLMLGTVTGVAPYVSMIRQALKDNIRGHHFYVMEGASHQDEFVYDSELERLAERMPELVTFVTTVSRPQAERNRSWNGPTGRVVVEEYMQRWSLPKEDTAIYLCGNPGIPRTAVAGHHLMLGTVTGVAPYVSMIRQALKDNIRANCSEPPLLRGMEGARHGWTSRKHQSWEIDYHAKAGSLHDSWQNDVQVDFHSSVVDYKKTFFIRSAYRNDPEFQVRNFQRVGDPLNEIRAPRRADAGTRDVRDDGEPSLGTGRAQPQLERSHRQG